MTELAKAFDGYACNRRLNLSTLLNAALNSTLRADGEITIRIGRWDALHSETNVMVKATGNNSWVINTEHKYRQQQGSRLPPTNQYVNDGRILYEKLREIIKQNICQIHVVTAGGVKHSYNTGDLNLFS